MLDQALWLISFIAATSSTSSFDAYEVCLACLLFWRSRKKFAFSFLFLSCPTLAYVSFYFIFSLQLWYFSSVSRTIPSPLLRKKVFRMIGDEVEALCALIGPKVLILPVKDNSMHIKLWSSEMSWEVTNFGQSTMKKKACTSKVFF